MHKTLLLPASAMAVMAFQRMDHAMSQIKCDLWAIAEEQIEKRFPDFDRTGMTPVVSEKGSVWELTYRLPAGMLGGAPIVTIDKRTCAVVRIEHSQ